MKSSTVYIYSVAKPGTTDSMVAARHKGKFGVLVKGKSYEEALGKIVMNCWVTTASSCICKFGGHASWDYYKKHKRR